MALKDYTNNMLVKTLKGHISKYLYSSPQSMFKVALFKVEDSGETIKITGDILNALELVPIEITGNIVKHKSYGDSFKISSFTKIENGFSKAGLIKYFSSESFPGVGEKKAKEIVDILGTDAIKKITSDKSVLDKVKSLTLVLRERIYTYLKNINNDDNTLIKLLELDIKGSFAQKIMEHPHYRQNPYEFIKENPYRLIDDFKNIGFKRADVIAQKVGIAEDDPRRIKALIIYILKGKEAETGNSYTTEDVIISSIVNEYRITNINLNDYLEMLVDDQKIIIENEKIFLKLTYDTELYIAKKLEAINKYDIKLNLKKIQFSKDYTFTTLQKQAIESALTNKVSIITGGPGTGKTTIIKEIIRLYELNNPKSLASDITLLAPTGRAAKRINEVINHNAKTIHRALEYDYSGKFNHDEANPLDTKLIIIDESSMIDIFLARALLSAVKYTTQIVFVGDVNQLPSVACGNFLSDIIEANLFSVTRLTDIFRQASNSQIINLATDINKNTLNLDNYASSTDVVTKYIKEEEELLSTIKKIVTYNLDKKLSIDDYQILIPMYRGLLGVDNINNEIQQIYINPSPTTPRYEYTTINQDGEKQSNFFYVGDKVIQIENDYQSQVMNGDIGRISAIIYKGNNPEITIDFDNLSVTYSREELSKIKLAYAITIHKAQGSEYKEIIMPIALSYYMMLKKELIYTGITRAKEKLYLIGDLGYLKTRYKEEMSKRKTNLVKLLKNAKEETTTDDSFDGLDLTRFKNLKLEDF